MVCERKNKSVSDRVRKNDRGFSKRANFLRKLTAYSDDLMGEVRGGER